MQRTKRSQGTTDVAQHCAMNRPGGRATRSAVSVATMLGATVALAAPSAAQAAEISLAVECEGTTENGVDELFVIAAGRTSRGRKVLERLPRVEGGYWHLKPTFAQGQTTLTDVYLSEGETLELVVVFFESDADTTASWQNIGSVMLGASPPADDVVVAGLTTTFAGVEDFRPAHDFLGAFEVTVESIGDAVSARWSALDHAAVVEEPAALNERTFRLQGDGGRYLVTATASP